MMLLSGTSHLYGDVFHYRLLGLLIIGVTTLFGFLRIRKAARSGDSSALRFAVIRSLIVEAGAVCLFVFIVLPQTEALERIQKNGAETQGLTIAAVRSGKSKEITYSYTVGDKQYKGQMNRKNGFWRHFRNIPYPGGRYIVVYERADPANSVMDFSRPLP